MQLGNNTTNHLLCYDCGVPHNVDVIARTNQAAWRTVCLNCATKPEYHDWYWRCTNNNCVRPILADNRWYCYYHESMYAQWLNNLD
jgi:hypothetical protein